MEARLIQFLHVKNWFYHFIKYFIFNYVRRLVIAANHISSADPPILGICLPRIVSYLAKKELFESLGMRLFITGLHAFPIDRSRADMSFIQGTRNSGDAEAMNGASFIAQRGGVPILPAAIRRRGKGYIISFGEILQAEDKSKESMQQLTDDTMDRIQNLVGSEQVAS